LREINAVVKRERSRSPAARPGVEQEVTARARSSPTPAMVTYASHGSRAGWRPTSRLGLRGRHDPNRDGVHVEPGISARRAVASALKMGCDHFDGRSR
jgi:hypothetical protein